MYKVLIAFDASDQAKAVLPHIGGLLTAIDAEVILLKVLPETGVLPTTAHREYNEARQVLDTTAENLKSNGIKVSTTIRYGKPAEEIVDYAWTHGVNLIAMPTHSRSRLSRWMFSTVTDKVSQRTSLPVFVIRTPCSSANGRDAHDEAVPGLAAAHTW